MDHKLELALLGSPDVRYINLPLTGFVSSKAQALLYYLAATDRAHMRAALAPLLWGDTLDSTARTNLRSVLKNLRHLVGSHLLIDAQQVAFNGASAHWIDVIHFVDSIKKGAAHLDIVLLENTLTLYRGDFLEGFYVRDAPDFEAWLVAERARYRELAVNALRILAAHYAGGEDWQPAIAHIRRLLVLEPWGEEAHRQLMICLARSGQRSAALAHFETCRQILAEELDVEPVAETVSVYEQIKAGGFDQGTWPRSDGQLSIGRHTEVTTVRVNNSQVPLSPGQPISPSRRLPMMETPLVGREQEWHTLQAVWQSTATMGPHFVCMAGEAGIGKTRLAEELLVWADAQGAITARTRAYAAGGELAYAPVIEWLRTEALQAAIVNLDDVWLTELARLLPELLTARTQLRRPEPLAERWQRQRLFEALARAFTDVPSFSAARKGRPRAGAPRVRPLGLAENEGKSDRQPVLLLIDDLQWCDRETLEWLHYLLHYDLNPRLLVVGTVRTEEVDPTHPLMLFLRELRRAGQTTDIEIRHLTAAETSTLAAHLAHSRFDADSAPKEPLGRDMADVTTKLYRYTEGNPLFIVETMRTGNWREALRHAELDTLPQLANRYTLPPKIHAVIQHRLTQLAYLARELAYLAAVLGRAFTFNLLVQASGKEVSSVMQGVDELWRRGIVREQGIYLYDFSHGLIREVAYAEIGPVQRPLLHQRVANALAVEHAEDIDAVSAIVAMHYAQAGQPEQAIGYYQRAAGVANDRFAYAETVEYLTKSLALLEHLPDTQRNQERELAILLQLREPLRIAKGWATPEQGPFSRAMELCRQVGTKQQLYKVLDAWRLVHQMRADLGEALHYAKQQISLAEELEKEGMTEEISESHLALGVILLSLGELKVARAHCERALTDKRLYRPLHRSMLLFWLLGYPDQAQRFIAESFAFGENAPHRLAVIHSFAARLECCLHLPTSVRERAERLLALATKHTLPFWLALGTLLRGWSRVEEGEMTAGIADLQWGITALVEANYFPERTFYLGLLAEAHGEAGHYREALAILDNAFDFLEKSGERYWHAELARLRGEFLLAQGVSAHAVEACYRQSLDIARQQSAKSLELRASLSLSRLWQQQGKYTEAHTLLADIYGEFTEGFDTADLIEAKELLQTLSRPEHRQGGSQVVRHKKY